ncbi:helix-turn-helix transcriptional regulator [Maricaulis sp.]|uniref:helix-turn-helix transcriptional regulator n=1 Tax=Maricaulis sp. TaxID=1486257 RepID=UPI003A8EC548
MGEFEFSVIASGLEADSETAADRFFEAGCDDATIAFARGVYVLAFCREAASFEDAITSALTDVREAGAQVERLEPDCLVSLSEIAERAGLSRAAPSLYALGKRGTGFPRPVARFTTSSPLYDWHEVALWLHNKGELDASIVAQAAFIKSLNRNLDRAVAAQ